MVYMYFCRKRDEIDLTKSPMKRIKTYIVNESSELDLTKSPKKLPKRIKTNIVNESSALWLPHLNLNQEDKLLLTSPTAWLNDKIVNASQNLLKEAYPHVDGL